MENVLINAPESFASQVNVSMANALVYANSIVNVMMVKFAMKESVKMLVILFNAQKKANVRKEYAGHNSNYAQSDLKSQKLKQPLVQTPDLPKKIVL